MEHVIIFALGTDNIASDPDYIPNAHKIPVCDQEIKLLQVESEHRAILHNRNIRGGQRADICVFPGFDP